MEKFSYSDKHILITGASGGLGSAIAKNLAAEGASLVVSSRSEKTLNELIATFPKNTHAVPVAADLSHPGDPRRLAEKAIEAMGHIDAVFNNAGVGYFSLMEETKEESIRHLFEVNTFAPLALIKALLPHMLQRGYGRFINIVSAAGRVPIPTVGVYGGSKSALAVMTNTMRLELGPKGIDVINVYPGTVDTAFEENALREEARPGLCPRDRCGEPRFYIAKKILEAAKGPPGEIWLEPQSKWFSTAAIFLPGFVERRLTSLRDKAIQKEYPEKRRWRLVQIESAIACNLSCVMCPWREITKNSENRGRMSQAVWESIRSHLSEIKSIDFTGGGEPLLQPKLPEWIAEANAQGCETGFLSNGLLLRRDKLQQILDSGVDWICISMDGADAEMYEKIRVGSNFERVCENLRNIAGLRSGNRPKTMINFVLMDMNFHQVEDIVRLAARLGVDQINFKQCDVIRGESGKGHGLFKAEETKEIRRLRNLLEKARRLAKKLNILTTAFSFTPEERPVCEQDPRDSLFIRYDGRVAPCINLAIGGPT
ncbi:MAG: SDR family NAD(P)-dependent oxidoreductase, partial [Desulfobacterales bacterium]|nr:SDR family NAD(P)-dependent oxidoreductase [Desulfobacterales bacterium]